MKKSVITMRLDKKKRRKSEDVGTNFWRPTCLSATTQPISFRFPTLLFFV